MGQIAQYGYGKANLSNTLATYSCQKVKPPFERISAFTSGADRGSKQTHSVGMHQHMGVLINGNVEHDNGTIILLQASWKRGGASIRDGALFLRLRAGAPLYRITGKVPTGAGNVYGDSFVMFSGNADILNKADLAVAGLEVNRSYTEKFMSLEELEECYEISMVMRETIPRPTAIAIATPEGIKMQEMAQPAGRRLRLRR